MVANRLSPPPVLSQEPANPLSWLLQCLLASSEPLVPWQLTFPEPAFHQSHCSLENSPPAAKTVVISPTV